MKLKMNIYIKGLKKAGERTIEVNDNISIKKFCEYIILSLNGNCKHLYQLLLNYETTYLCDGCNKITYEEHMMDDLTLEDIGLDVNDELMLNYDFKSDWEFILKVTENEEGYFNKEFNVTSGSGVGILEDCGGNIPLRKIINPNTRKDKDWYIYCLDGYEEYTNKIFDINNINQEIEFKLNEYYEKNKPKHYIMNINLEEYNKEIKRKISVDSNVKLDSFCRAVIKSMRGDLYHSYTIKKGKEYLDEEIIENEDLNYLELKEKQRLKIIYDFGDNWVFNITIAKVNEGYAEEKRFKVISGKGYGIVDDCGGPWGLEDIFNGTSEDWKKCDINEFDIDEINKSVSLEI